MTLAYVRDIAIILLAAFSLMVGLLLAILALQVYSLVRLVKTEMRLILTNTRETLDALKGGSHALGPPVSTLLRIGAVVGMVKGLASRVRRKKRR